MFEKLNSSFFVYFKKIIRFALNHIQNIENFVIKNLNQQNYIPNLYIKEISIQENKLKDYSPFSLISFGILICIFFVLLKKLYKKFKKIYKYFCNFKENFVLLLSKLPSNQEKISKAKLEVKKEMLNLFKQNKFKKIDFFDNGQDEYTILKKMEVFSKSDNAAASTGKLTGAVYCGEEKIHRIASNASEIFSYSNLLHPDLYCGARFIESQLIKIGLELFNGKEDSCGMTTSGGTMSILTAMYAYIHRARENGIKKPEIICPNSAHAAFFKACYMFRAKCIKIPLDPKTYQIDLNKAKKAINKNTACIVGSCPNFPHSIMDDIEGLNEIALKYKIPLHVDCCLGGFLVAFYNRANIKIPKFDFTLPGVTSISADLHKYGLCPKGISLLMYSKHEYRKYNYFTYPHFMGGFYCTPGFDGSRTAGISAASYAVLTSLGKNYYINIAKCINKAVVKVKEFVRKECPLFKIIGEPFICGFAITGEKMDYLYDILSKKGWHLNMIINPLGIGFIFTSANMENVDQLIKDIKEAHEKIKTNNLEELSKITKLYGMSIPLPESIAKNALDVLCDAILD